MPLPFRMFLCFTHILQALKLVHTETPMPFLREKLPRIVLQIINEAYVPQWENSQNSPAILNLIKKIPFLKWIFLNEENEY